MLVRTYPLDPIAPLPSPEEVLDSREPERRKALYQKLGMTSLAADVTAQVRLETARAERYPELTATQYKLYCWFFSQRVTASSYRRHLPNDVAARFELAQNAQVFQSFVIISRPGTHEAMLIANAPTIDGDHYFLLAHWTEGDKLTEDSRMVRFSPWSWVSTVLALVGTTLMLVGQTATFFAVTSEVMVALAMTLKILEIKTLRKGSGIMPSRLMPLLIAIVIVEQLAWLLTVGPDIFFVA